MDNPYAPPVAADEVLEPPTGGLGPGWDVGTVISRSWELFRSQPGVLVASALIPMIVSIAFAAAGQVVALGGAALFGEDGMIVANLLSVGISFASNLVGLFFWLGQARIAIAVVRGQQADLALLVSGGPFYLTALLASVLMYVGFVVGLCALIVPGVILLLGVAPYLYLIVDRQLEAVEALKRAWALTDGAKVQIFLWSLAMMVVSIIGVLFTCGLGVVVVGPLWSLGMALIYESLSEEHALREAAT